MRLAVKIFAPILALLIVLIIYIYIVNIPREKSQPVEMNIDSLAAQLPHDLGQARKQIARTQKTLAKKVPSEQYIVINTHSNKIYLRDDSQIYFEATCSTGSGDELVDSATGRHWIFNTPTGIFKVTGKLKDPWWRKPDWAYIEEKEEIPKNDKERYDPEMMGDYAIGFGDGYFIHGTIYERLLGVSVTHGCVRVGAEDLEVLYKKVKYGTPVYIF